MSKKHNIPQALENRVIENVSLADIEHVGLDRILSVIQEALREQGDTAKEMFVSLKRVPFICVKIESIEEHMSNSDKKFDHLIEIVERNWVKSQDQHENFVTKTGMESFTAVYKTEQSSMKKAIYGCTTAIMLAILANFISRFIAF